MANTIKLKRSSSSDPSASDLAVGEIAIRTSNCKLFSKNDGGSAIGIVAGSADILTTARTIAGVSFNGSANISLNNNAITNGAGYITDLVNDSSPQLGGDLDLQSNGLTTSTSNGNIKATPNGSGVFEVRGAGGNDGTLQLNCSFQSHGIKLRSPAHSAGQSYTFIFPDNNITADKYLKVKSISGSGSTASGQLEYASLDANDLGEGTIPDARFPSTLPALNGSALTNLNASNIASGTISASRIPTLNQNTTGSAATLTTARTIGGVSFDGSANINLPGVNTSGNQNTSGNAATATKLAATKTIAGVAFDGSANISLNNNAITNGAGYITSADGGNAATLDSIDSSQFLRSDTADSSNSLISLNGGVSISGRASSNVSTVSSGSTITLDMTSSTHFFVDLGTNTTFASPSNQSSAIGQSGSIFIQQDGGSRTASFNSVFKFNGGTAPTLSTADNAVDRIDYIIKANNEIHAVISLDVK